MTNGQESPTGVARTVENRAHARRKLTTMAYVELGRDNGGILLNLGEGGLAVQSALTLAGPEFPDIRFQLPNSKRWLMARGRVTWMSESRTEAGLQFLDLRPEMQAHIRKWIALAGEESPVLPPIQAANPANAQRTRQPQVNGKNFSQAASASAAMGIGVGEGSPSAQDFRFHDYSMFSEAGPEHLVTIPARSRWKSFALLAMCLAVLFFVLGASFGRYTFDQWLQPRAPEQQTPAAPPIPNGINPNTTNSTADQDAQNESKANERPNLPIRTPDNAAESAVPTEQSTTAANNQPVTESNSDASPTESEKANSLSARPEASAKMSAPVAATRVPEHRNAKSRVASHILQPLRPLAPAYRDQARANADGAHTILVNAPAPGSPAFFVNLTNEAVDASEWVAISTARSVWIGPKSNGDGYSRTERVTIGRLISHTQPFYPQEARNRHLDGNVVLRATFGRTGTLLKVAPMSGPPLLAAAGMTAVREWRYAPTFIDGDPVETQADITMVFRLR